MKAYKGFNYDMKCNGFQYEEGQTYECEKAMICEEGFHACLRPTDCFQYYSPDESVFHEVELDGEIDTEPNTTKVCATRITIGRRLTIYDMMKADEEYIKENQSKFERNLSRKEDLDDIGYTRQGITLRNSDDMAVASDSGIAQTGSWGLSIGNESSLAITGDFGTSFSYYGTASSGYYGKSICFGVSNTGENGLAVSIGINPVAKGGKGSTLVFIRKTGSRIDNMKSIVIDDENYKSNTWYWLDWDGNVVPDPDFNFYKRNLPV